MCGLVYYVFTELLLSFRLLSPSLFLFFALSLSLSIYLSILSIYPSLSIYLLFLLFLFSSLNIILYFSPPFDYFFLFPGINPYLFIQGVLTKSDGDWEQVAVKMIKDTDLMSQSAFEDMDREIGLVDID